jgi:spore germination cell wall hydrolase CwlJ-like protein
MPGPQPIDKKLHIMNGARLFLTIISLLAAGILPDRSSVRDASGTTSGEALFGFSIAAPTDALDGVSPTALESLSENEARAANLRAPFSDGQHEVASPLFWPLEPERFPDRASATDCLTAAIYYEAASEPLVGKRAVAQVVLNRVRHPAFPNSVCGVVMQGASRKTGCQFTFTCDGSLYRAPSRSGWESARQVALAALSGVVEPSVGWATHYHADYVRPYWASSLGKVAAIGNHLFYRWPGAWGRRKAFTQTLAQDREYEIFDAAQWRLAASYLHDLGDLRNAQAVSLADMQTHQSQPSASDRMNLPDLPKPPRLVDRPMTPEADRERGTLLADQIGGTLIVN